MRDIVISLLGNGAGSKGVRTLTTHGIYSLTHTGLVDIDVSMGMIDVLCSRIANISGPVSSDKTTLSRPLPDSVRRHCVF